MTFNEFQGKLEHRYERSYGFDTFNHFCSLRRQGYDAETAMSIVSDNVKRETACMRSGLGSVEFFGSLESYLLLNY